MGICNSYVSDYLLTSTGAAKKSGESNGSLCSPFSGSEDMGKKIMVLEPIGNLFILRLVGKPTHLTLLSFLCHKPEYGDPYTKVLLCVSNSIAE